MAIPRGHDLWLHERCAGACTWANGSQLSAATLKHICHTLRAATAPDRDGAALVVKRSHARLAADASRDKRTVMVAVGHLLRVGLLAHAELRNGEPMRGGGRGMYRGAPSVYELALPDIALLKLIGLDVDAMLARLEATRQPAPQFDFWSRQPVGAGARN